MAYFSGLFLIMSIPSGMNLDYYTNPLYFRRSSRFKQDG